MPYYYNWSRRNPSYVVVTKTTTAAMSSLGTTPTLLAGTFATAKKTSDWAVTATGGVLTYTGPTKSFMLDAQLCFDSSNARQFLIQLSKDGGSTFVSTLGFGNHYLGTTTAGAYQIVPFGGYVSVVSGDTLGIYLNVVSSTTDVNLASVKIEVRDVQ